MLRDKVSAQVWKEGISLFLQSVGEGRSHQRPAGEPWQTHLGPGARGLPASREADAAYVGDAADEEDVTEHPGRRGQGADVREAVSRGASGPPQHLHHAARREGLICPKCSTYLAFVLLHLPSFSLPSLSLLPSSDSSPWSLRSPSWNTKACSVNLRKQGGNLGSLQRVLWLLNT